MRSPSVTAKYKNGFIKNIAYLRTLEISIEDIRNIMSNKVSLTEIIEKQTATIQTQIEGLNKAKTMCERMLESENISFDELQVEKYIADLETYWNDNKPIFKLDSVSFLYMGQPYYMDNHYITMLNSWHFIIYKIAI